MRPLIPTPLQCEQGVSVKAAAAAASPSASSTKALTIVGASARAMVDLLGEKPVVESITQMAENEDPVAQVHLGACHSSTVGIGLERDDEKALYWYKKAAENGNVAGQFNYGVMLHRKGKNAEALLWYEKAADSGLPDAIHALARLWHTGFHGKKGRYLRDMAKAQDYYERALSQGFYPAKADLCQLQKEMAWIESL